MPCWRVALVGAFSPGGGYKRTLGRDSLHALLFTLIGLGIGVAIVGMSNFSSMRNHVKIVGFCVVADGCLADCFTKASIQPNSTVLAGIQACQAAANTSYCFPPNGTRICAPAEDIPCTCVHSPYQPHHPDITQSSGHRNTTTLTQELALYTTQLPLGSS